MPTPFLNAASALKGRLTYAYGTPVERLSGIIFLQRPPGKTLPQLLRIRIKWISTRCALPDPSARGHCSFPIFQKPLSSLAKMKTILLVAVMMAALALNAVAAEGGKEKKKAKRPGPVKHMVAFKFKDDVSQADIDKLNAAFKDLKKKIDVIRTFDSGLNNSPEKLNKGFTHGYLLSFDTTADRDTYLNHPAHKEFGQMAMKMLADVFVLDFESGSAKGKKGGDEKEK
jgi:hypothetical protein